MRGLGGLSPPLRNPIFLRLSCPPGGSRRSVVVFSHVLICRPASPIAQ
jgi:hypothetical protein